MSHKVIIEVEGGKLKIEFSPALPSDEEYKKLPHESKAAFNALSDIAEAVIKHVSKAK